ncbi:hypothetical protein ACWA1F_10325 [Flavobacterium sp. 3-218]
MNLINVKQDFEIVLENILLSKILSNSNQKTLLLVLLYNHKKFNRRHYSFTLSDELSAVLNVSNPTFRKERDKLEALNLIHIKVEVNGVKKIVEKAQRKHSNLYYYLNFTKLHQLGFIKMEKGLEDIFNIGVVLDLKKAEKLADEKLYNIIRYDLTLKERKSGKRLVLTGREIKGYHRIMNSNFKHGSPIENEYEYHGLNKAGQDFLLKYGF